MHICVNGDEIVSTPTHPFYSHVRGWTSTVDLRAGDILVLSNGEYVIVEQVQHEILEVPVKVYNFEVQDFHTYYVGKNSVLVHNYCDEVNGSITYKERDALGRSTDIEATIIKDMIGTGTRTSTKVNPVGFEGQVSGHARGHLLGKQLGGSGTDKRNLVTIFQNPVNHPVMSSIESQFRRAVENG